MENASNDSIFIHLPFFEDLFNGERMNNIWLACLAELGFVSFGGDLNCMFNTLGFDWFLGVLLVVRFLILRHYVIIIAYEKSFVDRWKREP